MSRETLLNAKAPVCEEAVRLFASEIVHATALRPVVEAAEDAVDVAFLDDTGMKPFAYQSKNAVITDSVLKEFD